MFSFYLKSMRSHPLLRPSLPAPLQSLPICRGCAARTPVLRHPFEAELLQPSFLLHPFARALSMCSIYGIQTVSLRKLTNVTSPSLRIVGIDSSFAHAWVRLFNNGRLGTELHRRLLQLFRISLRQAASVATGVVICHWTNDL